MHGSFQEQQSTARTESAVGSRSFHEHWLSPGLHGLGNPCEPLHQDPTFSPTFLFCHLWSNQMGNSPPTCRRSSSSWISVS